AVERLAEFRAQWHWAPCARHLCQGELNHAFAMRSGPVGGFLPKKLVAPHFARLGGSRDSRRETLIAGAGGVFIEAVVSGDPRVSCRPDPATQQLVVPISP